MAEFTLRVYQRIAGGVPVMSLIPKYSEARFQLSPFLVFGPRVDHQLPGKTWPELAYFNEQGLRTDETVGPKDPDEFRILAVGGSTTENVWNEAGIHWPLALECALRDHGRPHVRVLNAGMSAYTTAHSLIRLQFDLLDLDPDLVLVMHNINDLSVAYAAHRAGAPVDGHYSVKYADPVFTGVVSEDDVVVSRLSWTLGNRLGGSSDAESDLLEGYDLETAERVFRRNLETIKTVVESRGSEVSLITMPYSAVLADAHRDATSQPGITDIPAVDSFEADMRRYNQAILDVAGERGIDMAGLFGESRHDFVDVVHYSTRGVTRFGQLLAPMLIDKIPEAESLGHSDRAAMRRCDWFGNGESQG